MADDGRAAKRQRFASEIICVRVGSTKELLKVHEDLLKERSAFFRAALKKNWKEGRERVIILPEDETDVVTAYLDYLYAGQLQECLDEDVDASFIFISKLYVFGEKIQDDAFCNEALTLMAKGVDRESKRPPAYVPGYQTISLIYKATPEGSPMRRFLVDIYVDRSGRPTFKDSACVDECPEFLLDLVRGLLTAKAKHEIKSFTAAKEKWMKKT